MIASDRTAVRVGSSLLVVDGTDETFNRKAEISIQPGRVKGKKLQEGPIALSREVYNAGLEERRGRWKWNQESVSVIDQFNEIPGLRELRSEIETFGSQLVRGALRLADDAMNGFFRRVIDGQKPGYPRFKAKSRWKTVYYPEPVGWALRRLGGADPALYVQGIGEIKLSRPAVRQLVRLADRGGTPRTLTITETRTGPWRACVGFRGVAPDKRWADCKPPEAYGAFDRGLPTVVTPLRDSD